MHYTLLKKIKHFIITLKSSILAIFITLLLTTTLLIILATTIRFTTTINYVSQVLMQYASSSVLHQLNANIHPVQVKSHLIAQLMNQNVIKDKPEHLIPLTLELSRSLPQIVSAFWGNEQGYVVHAKKELDGSVTSEIYDPYSNPRTKTTIYRTANDKIIKQETIVDESYDPRLRPWYIAAKKEKDSIWTDLYLFAPFVDVGISTATPVYKQGKFYGAFGISINLEYLSQFLSQQKITAHGFSFVINEKGNFIAFPNKPPFSHIVNSTSKVSIISAQTIPLISQSLAEFKKSGKSGLTFTFPYEGEKYMVTYESIPAFTAHGWLIGVIVPRSDFTHLLDKINGITLSISLIILILGIVLVSRLSRYIVKPLKSLVTETELIKNFNLDHEIPISSRIKEIIVLKDAINSMKLGLKLFQRYIPKILVRQLIESGGNVGIGGERKSLAVLFSDIENFTTIAEKIEPNLLMVQMGEYFEDMTQIIIKEKGTIDKYIGDSIMAFWGAPLAVENPCHRAAKAALNFQSTLVKLNAQWIKQGKLVFLTRIGIHTGDAIVGNLGSSERFSYTALGDTINIASRLEDINKYYNTRIIVSDAVYEQIKDSFLLRMVDCVIVKGRTHSTYIYELLGDAQQQLTFDLRAYNAEFEKAFLAYKEQNWDKAQAYFKNCLEIYPEDYIAPLFINRCESFKLQPPMADWDGVME